MTSPHFRTELAELIRNAHERLDSAKHLLTVSEPDERKVQQVIQSTEKAHRRLDAAARILMNAIDEEAQGTDELFADENAPIKPKVEDFSLPVDEKNPKKGFTLEDLILADDEEELYNSSPKSGPKFSSSLNIHLEEADLSYSAISKKTTKF